MSSPKNLRIPLCSPAPTRRSNSGFCLLQCIRSRMAPRVVSLGCPIWGAIGVKPTCHVVGRRRSDQKALQEPLYVTFGKRMVERAIAIPVEAVMMIFRAVGALALILPSLVATAADYPAPKEGRMDCARVQIPHRRGHAA